jgi:hypothetical protein
LPGKETSNLAHEVSLRARERVRQMIILLILLFVVLFFGLAFTAHFLFFIAAVLFVVSQVVEG